MEILKYNRNNGISIRTQINRSQLYNMQTQQSKLKVMIYANHELTIS